MVDSSVAGTLDLVSSNARYSTQINNARQADSAEEARLRKATEDFEAIFIKQMLDTMRKTVSKSGLIDGGYAETIYEDMLYDEYAQKMASTSRLGIAEMLYKQMSNYI